jgi:hypothetical protein
MAVGEFLEINQKLGALKRRLMTGSDVHETREAKLVYFILGPSLDNTDEYIKAAVVVGMVRVLILCFNSEFGL